MQTKAETELYIHTMDLERTQFEAGLQYPLDEVGKQWVREHFLINFTPAFFCLVAENKDSFFPSAQKLLQLDILSHLLNQFSTWLNLETSSKIETVRVKARSSHCWHFWAEVTIDGKRENIQFEFTNDKDKASIVFSTEHHDEACMITALHITKNWLVQQMNTQTKL